MIKQLFTHPLRALLAMAMAAGSTVLLTSCDDNYGRGYHRGSGPHQAAPYGRGLKPKEKARLGMGRHAGHPHGGPPGQRKKARRW